jgi:hypothetical protein
MKDDENPPHRRALGYLILGFAGDTNCPNLI